MIGSNENNLVENIFGENVADAKSEASVYLCVGGNILV